MALSLCLTLLPHAVEAAESPGAHARRLLLTGRYAEAAAAYQALPKDEATTAALGLACCQRETGKTEQAEKTLRAALGQSPRSADLAGALAELLFDGGRHEESQQLATQALDIESRQFTARWVLAELHRAAGRLREAERAYAWFVDDYNAHEKFTPEQLHRIGLAAAQYARWKRNNAQFQFLVNTLYPDTRKLDPQYWRAHLGAARLFLEKYNTADAKAELDAALAINPQAAEAHVTRAWLALQNFDLANAKSALDRALAIYPQLLDAHQCRADCLLAELRTPEALAVLESARSLDPVNDETLGRLAAAYGALDGLKNVSPDSRLGKLIAEVSARNPHCGEFYQALANSLDVMRRYPAAAEYYREAQRRMPQLLYAEGQLGLIEMRLGREAEAAKRLEASFRADPFNVRVKNMLEVLDVLKSYRTVETPHFLIRFDPARDELLARYVARYLEDEVYPQVVQKLGHAPAEKSLLEIFSRARNSSGHAWFSARMVGLPFVGTVAACAGQMIAMTSPNDMPTKKFNWARVLRHEFVHVVSLQQTDFNIPHWYTESLAVLQEDTPRPAEWTQTLVRRAKAGTLLDLNTINLAFIRPRERGDWALAYCQAELYAEFMLHQYGGESLSRLLTAYAENATTPAAVQRCFGVPLPEFEAAYRAYLDGLVGKLQGIEDEETPNFAALQRAAESDPEDTKTLVRLAEEFVRRRDYAQARKLAQKVRQAEPRNSLAAYVLALVYLSIGDQQQAIQLLQETLDEQSPHAKHLTLLARLRTDAGEWDAAESLVRLGLAKCPPPEKWLKSLTRIYLKTGEQRKLAETLQQLAQAGDEQPLVSKKLAELALADQDFAAARRWATQTLQIDVQDAEAHALLAQARSSLKDYEPAIEEYQTAIQLAPDHADWRLALAEVHVQVGQKERAIEVLQQLLSDHPGQAGARERLEKLKP